MTTTEFHSSEDGSAQCEDTTLLLFGPQALSANAETLNAFRDDVSSGPESTWIAAALESLPGCWEAFVTAFPKYCVTQNASSLLSDLYRWFQAGSGSLPSTEFPNTILSPLVVISHLSEYMRLLDMKEAQQGEKRLDVLPPQTERQFEKFGATAIRLAMIIGGIVDAQEILETSGPTKALATSWDTDAKEQEMSNILQLFPDSYISVVYDEKRSTVTVPRQSSEQLQQALGKEGIVAVEIGLRGRFHSQCYSNQISSFITYCSANADLALPSAEQLVYPLWCNTGDGASISAGPLHDHGLRTMLVYKSDWHQLFEAARTAAMAGKLNALVISFGPERCVPPSMMRKLGPQGTVIHMADARTRRRRKQPDMTPRPPKEDDVAVIGMSIKVAGADDVDEFWDLLCRGESQHKQVPADRLKFDHVWRETNANRKWYGNFINDPDAFDHRFFNKSAREMISTDPQQRHMMQVAYQALEQSGYFGSLASNDNKIGCFVGVCSADYEHNAACHPANAFTAIGNLKSFIAGKISHYFGWVGPSMCIDTACSSSLVAVHQACKAVLSGECSSALAGGANIMTNSLWFENLAGASFLSPTGQCRPFDVSADGYCRAEGFAAVVVKKMSKALADGDQILGTILSSAVYQNHNCTPVFVPNAASLADLFRDVVDQARLSPGQIGAVEAHGTGTQVGDPAEYDGIKQVLGGPGRPKPLALGSVKGVVGHTECASGAVSLVKTLLMVQRGIVPPQGSFKTMNTAISAMSQDQIDIVTDLRPWKVSDKEFRATLINNYGASGSNASMVVSEAPFAQDTAAVVVRNAKDVKVSPNNVDHLFRIFGHDERAIKAYCERLMRFLSTHAKGQEHKMTISTANVAFNLSRQGNPTLDKSYSFKARSLDQLMANLEAAVAGKTSVDIISASKIPQRPVVLCFGGQVSTFVGLDRGLYDSCTVLRIHLDACDAICVTLPGVGSIFPGIFDRTPISDPVRLQTMLFAMQYACARSWMDSGVRPVALVGHSFGELVAMCISGSLALHDALVMVSGRAAVIREHWGQERGSMMAVEGHDEQIVQDILVASKSGATIACFNGPTSFTLAGTGAEALKLPTFASVRSKRLNVTNAFHSTLVDALKDHLVQVGGRLKFRKPTIPIELATRDKTDVSVLSEEYVADHMRNPVYFHHALQRIAHEHPNCIYLEAGFNSTVAIMAGRALGWPKSSYFQSLSITGDGAGQQVLVSATLSLWKEGLKVDHWAHNRAQTYAYAPLMLPPYQFEKSRHWLEMKAPPKTTIVDKSVDDAQPVSDRLFSFTGYADPNQRVAQFRINTETDKYKTFVSRHKVASTAPICPATLMVDMVIEALFNARPELSPSQSDLQPQILSVQNVMAICIDESRTAVLQLEAEDTCTASRKWGWKITSTGPSGVGPERLHVTGQLYLASTADDKERSEFKRYERLAGGHRHCVQLLGDADADYIIHGGRNIYRAFADVVDYAEPYQGVERLVGKGDESAGRVVKQYSGDTWLDTHLSDCFSQVAGSDMYIATALDKWMRSPELGTGYPRPGPGAWHVLARHERAEDGSSFLSDLFVFDPATGSLTEAMLGIHYHRVSKLSMGKILARFTPGLGGAESSAAASRSIPGKEAQTKESANQKTTPEPAIDVSAIIRQILSSISGLELAEIADDSGLAEIGIDSLMGMELGREMEGAFKTPLMGDELAQVTTFRELVAHVAGVLGVVVADQDGGSDAVDDSFEYVSSNSTEPTVTLPSDSDSEMPTKLGRATQQGVQKSAHGSLQLLPSLVFEAFEETKSLTDDFIAKYRCADYMDTVVSKQTHLCVALTVEAFELLGCPLRSAKAGHVLERITHEREHTRLAEWLYKLLEKEARLIDVSSSGVITRTAVQAPKRTSDGILAELRNVYPDHEWANRLTYFAGSHLAQVLRGEQDGIKLIFGTDEGRELVTGLYGDSLLNKLANVQMQDMMQRLIGKITTWDGPLKIMELGAGTGGTTKGMVPLLASLGIPVEYTFTDLSASFVAAARKSFGKEYPFMKFRVHDIEKAPASELVGTQHVVIASNAIHATHSLSQSLASIRKALRPDGFLMMLEMTEPLWWVDMIFGLFQGWWLFDDGRRHAIAHQDRWKSELRAAGYFRVDWTDGWRPETRIQRVIVAQDSENPGFSLDATPMTFTRPSIVEESAVKHKLKAQLDGYVRQYTRDFTFTSTGPRDGARAGITVAVTGATGSLGAHLVSHFASLPDVKNVFCLNRYSASADAEDRQAEALASRGIRLSQEAKSKLRVLAVDSAKPLLGLQENGYLDLCKTTTHIVHNAWAMTGKRPVGQLEPQFAGMRNIIYFARDAAASQHSKISFLFVSSIAVMGHHSLIQGNDRFAPEERAVLDQILPNGYAQAKWVCERMLDETLHRHPDTFRTTSVRPGQIAGSTTSGYWNADEHLSFLIKSSQTLNSLPHLSGEMSWTPVNLVAGTVADLVLANKTPHPVYHIDNPVRQPWSEVLPVLAAELGVLEGSIVPFTEWVQRVRTFPGSLEDNPAGRLIDFLNGNFIRMSCGGMILETKKACEDSVTLNAVGPVDLAVVTKYLDWWKRTGLLHPVNRE
ncbi:Beta-ketoacyl synthase [Metarhizium guizhouense ARSEF 977]|uniref:Beta-ketoacyl synthase n=1 Tax=Metarhizium guizhouense (strain ARSEF 977) TaxID=1276136 RepID=A0A0B4HR69_METGA|nr:Beta-ketoacyl synthase [Metarhizium guizhouense ARSEF 977]